MLDATRPTMGSFHWNLMVVSRLSVIAFSSIPRMLLRFQLALNTTLDIIVITAIIIWVICMYLMLTLQYLI